MTFIIISSAIAMAVMAVVFLCLRPSRVEGVSTFAASASVGSFAIALGAVGSLVLPTHLVSLPESPLVILSCLLLLSGFRQFLSMPALRWSTLIATVLTFSFLHFGFVLLQGGVTSVIGTGAVSVIFAAIGWTIYRGKGEADAPRAFVVFAILSASTVSIFFMARCVMIATGLGGTMYFAEPTAWNIAISSIRILMFPLVYLSAILLVQGRTVARLERALAHDDLTGALSRRAFFDTSARELDHEHSQSSAPLLLFLDLDNFKQLNDRHGHDVGDRALRHFVEVASSILPPKALLGRLGGEEFVILLPASEPAVATLVAKKIMRTIRETPLRTNRGSVPMTVSIGIAAAHPGMSIDDALKRADSALYQAKERGRDRLCLADETLSGAENPNINYGLGFEREPRSRIEAPPPLAPVS